MIQNVFVSGIFLLYNVFKKTTHFAYNLKQPKEQEKSNDLIEKMAIFVQYIFERVS